MKRIMIFVWLFLYSSLYGSGIDSAILWINDIPDGSSRFSATDPYEICQRKFQVSASYSRPYGINGLDWGNLFAGEGFGRWGTFSRFITYGLENYYIRYTYSAGVAAKVTDSISAAVDGQYDFEHFDKVGGFGKAEMNVRLSYLRGAVRSVVGLNGIKIAEEYRSLEKNQRAWGAVALSLKNGMLFSGSVKQFVNGRYRWLFSQHTRITRDLGLSLGVINRPDVIFGRLLLTRGSVSFDLTYYSISRLGDTVVLGLALVR